jgi:hypothetical protein
MPELPVISITSKRLPRSQLFTVRLWLEDLGEGRSEWRGKVEHVLSGQTRYFRDWATLITFLQEMLESCTQMRASRKRCDEAS